jgi:D-amino-acid dehydrogenase
MQAPAREEGGRHVAVIGAGIVGACCAYALRRAGFEVTLIERDQPGHGASFGNAGSIGTASVPPLGLPGMLRQVPAMLRDPLHPLAIRWRDLPRVLPWFRRFVRALDPARVEAIADARAALLAHAADAYEGLLDEIGQAHLIQSSGLITVWESEAAMAASRSTIEMRRARGIAMEEMSGERLRELEPALSERVRCGIWFPDVRATVSPLRLTEAIIEAFRARGGRLLAGEVVSFEIGPEGPRRVVMRDGGLDCDLVVVAAGVWSRDLVRLLGLDVALAAERGYHVMITEPKVALRIPLMSGDRNIAITPMEHGLRMTTMAEFATPEAPPDHPRAERILKAAAGIVRGLEFNVASRWVGPRPSTPDSLPVIGRCPRFANVFHAYGHGHLGLTFGAITGRLIAQLARGDLPNIDLAPYRPDRDYGGGHLLVASR